LEQQLNLIEPESQRAFFDTLKDIYYAETQIYRSLPKMAKAAASEQLRAAFEMHHDETEGQIERLEQVFELLGKLARGKKCDAIEGIFDEGKEITEEYKGRRSSMPASSRRPKPSNTTRFPARAPSRPGRSRSACEMHWNFSTRRWLKRRRIGPARRFPPYSIISKWPSLDKNRK
jgi:hypothetical protein